MHGTSPPPTERIDHLWIRSATGLERVDIKDVSWLEAKGDYVRIHAAGGSHLLLTTLTGLTEKLQSWGFIRVHRSAAVRSDLIRALRADTTGLIAVLSDGSEVVVGRRFGSSLRAITKALDRP